MKITKTDPIKQGTVLVTGATMGIGAAIADRMAQEGMDLVLVARDAARLEAAAKRLRADHGVEVLAVPLDLSHEQASVQLAERLKDERVAVEVLVNNAGVAQVGPVADTNPARMRALVDVNARAVAELTSLLLPDMLVRGHGAIVNIASTAAYAPAPYNAAYGASKAFVLSFTRAVWAETKRTGVRVVAVSPGATETPMNTRPVPGKRQPEQVAETVMKALRGRGPAIVDGRFNTVQAFVFSRILPTRTATRISGQFFRKAALES
ncbi:SDR family NAD(P)-dependent oxidoreductase [Streptomyces sp. NPDC001544]|uniref:SDR family NAD(P)-dependent oxidoreductase n=1 Tax=Streptomyces sp. NPDC001544 TaxID=3364584 RepID=UPI0036A26252